MGDRIEILDASRLAEQSTRDSLAQLLVAVVDDGGSLGFLAPLSSADAAAYWKRTAAAVASGDAFVLVCNGTDRIAGTVQLLPSPWPDGPHRAEVAKLMVHPASRRLGIARALMDAVEELAAELGRTLLTLNTRVDDPSERLYRSRGYASFGVVPRYLTDGSQLYDKSHWYRDLTRPPTA